VSRGEEEAGAWIARLARHGEEREAIRFEGGRLDPTPIDYVELAESALEAGQRLGTLGLAAGDRVAVLAPPSIPGVTLIHALLDQGIVLLPLNARLQEPELDFILASSRARWLVVGEAGQQARRLAERAGCGLLRLGAASGQGPRLRLEVERRPQESDGSALESQRVGLRERGAALVLYTSGTSGRPKGAVLTRDNLLASARAQAQLLGPSAPRDRWLLCMPLFHVAGLSVLIRSALAGTAVALHPDFDSPRVSASLERGGITHVSFVATMLRRVLEERGGRRAPSDLRVVLLGGGPASSDLLERAAGLGYPVAPTYGLTEAASQVATRPPDAPIDPSGDRAAGLRPLPGVEIRIVDAAGHELPPGTVGGVEVRGPVVMAGYLDDPEASARVLRDGWLATGDLGRLDASGGLRVLDRRADLIVSGGENVYPAEIEAVLEAHPRVVEAGVVGVDDERFGRRPVAFVVWQGGEDPEAAGAAAALGRWCRDRLAAFKRPVEIRILERLPRTASGKLIRRQLEERVRQEPPSAPDPGRSWTE